MFFTSQRTSRSRIHKDYVSSIKERKYISERIMILELKEKKEKLSITVGNGPNKDEVVERKNEYFYMHWLVRPRIILLGDVNGRVSNAVTDYENVLGPHGDPERNANGKRILQFCLANNVKILNTMFPHKRIHMYTREEPNRNENSVIN